MASKYRIAKQYGIPYQESWDQRHMGSERGVPDWMKQPALPPLMSSSSTHRSENEFLKKGSVQGDAGVGNMKLGTGSDPRGNAQMQAVSNIVDQPFKYNSPNPAAGSGGTYSHNAVDVVPAKATPKGFLSDEDLSAVLQSPVEEAKFTDVLADRDYSPPVASETVSNVAKPSTLSKASDFFSEHTTPIMAGMQVIGGFQQYSQRGDALDNLNDMISGLEGAEQGLANADYANVRYEKDKHSEQRRRIGEKGNIELSRKLGKIRNANVGNIISGSKKKMQESIKDEIGSETGITLASAYERHLENLTNIQENDRKSRMEIGNKLKEMRNERDRLQKEQDNQFLNTTLDVIQTAAMASNPALGMAIGVGRSFV